VLSSDAGGGSTNRVDSRCWLTPHPHADITIDLQWPDVGLTADPITIGADDIAAATEAAIVLWPWTPLDDMEQSAR
jgi:hypothetical protein